jgi:hypothetical protein
MSAWQEAHIQVIGGTYVIVQLVESWEIDGPPHMELSTRFFVPVEGDSLEWGYSIVLSDFLTADYMEQEFRQEVARWERLASHG